MNPHAVVEQLGKELMSKTNGQPDATSRRALVTGATGYIGRHLLQGLVDANWEAHALVRPNSESEVAAAALHIYDGTFESVSAAIESSRPHVVFHLASAVVVEHKPGDIVTLIASNITFPTFILEALAKHDNKKLINVGTPWQHFEGTDVYNPANLYAATKQAFEDLCAFYVEARGFSITNLKPSEVYGPDDHRGKIIPLLLRLIEEGGSLAMSAGEQILDFVYVTDVVSAFCHAADRLIDAPPGMETYAVRSGEEHSLREVVALLEKTIAHPLNIEWGGRPYRAREVMRPWGLQRIVPDWRPEVQLTDGLTKVVEWSRARPLDTKAQINRRNASTVKNVANPNYRTIAGGLPGETSPVSLRR